MFVPSIRGKYIYFALYVILSTIKRVISISDEKFKALHVMRITAVAINLLTF